MKTLAKRVVEAGIIGACLNAAVAVGLDNRPPDPGSVRPELPKHEAFHDKAQLASAFAESWPKGSRALARAILERYGAPDSVAASQLIWTNRRPFRTVVVYREEDWLGHGVLEQTIAYRVPVARWSELTAFSNGVAYDPARETLSVRGSGEEVNMLALNVAHELVRGSRDVSDARAFYKKILALTESGKSSRYTKRLLFDPSEDPVRRRLLRRLP